MVLRESKKRTYYDTQLQEISGDKVGKGMIGTLRPEGQKMEQAA